jgi:hypothetical protein
MKVAGYFHFKAVYTSDETPETLETDETSGT